MRVGLLLFLTLFHLDVAAGTFDRVFAIRHAQDLYDQTRFRDAELAFNDVYLSMRDGDARDIDTFMVVIDYLARSISQQGRNDRVADLMQERHDLISRHYDDGGYLFASSLARVAESLYRKGNRHRAVELTHRAVDLYQHLNPIPHEEMALAKRNITQYQLADYSTARLPMDLSDFYSRCEKIEETTDPAQADQLMANYIEIGVDYLPKGKWEAFFQIVTSPDQDDHSTIRRVFIPDTSESMRDQLCFVSIESGRIISVQSTLE